MKINYNTQNPHNISFKAQKLFPVVLEKTLANSKKVPVNAYFSRLEKSDIAELYAQRSELKKSKYGFYILMDFVRLLKRKAWGTDFFMIEVPSEKNTQQKIKGLVSIFKGKNWTEIINLQTLKNSNDHIKGVGSSMLYGVCKLAQEKGNMHIELDAAGKHLFDFYKNLGFKQVEINPCRFFLTDQDYDSFLKNIENKYKK